MEIQTIQLNNHIKLSIISFSILLVLYLGISIYFTNHFYFRTVINGINASGKTVDELDKEISFKCETYALELEERSGVKEQIRASDIDLRYNANGKLQAFKDNQNAFAWIYSFFSPQKSEMSGIVSL